MRWIGACLAALLPALAAGQTPPPAAQPAEPERATALSGYMDFHFNQQELSDARLDFHRFVLLVSTASAIASVRQRARARTRVCRKPGSVGVGAEQAYVDFLFVAKIQHPRGDRPDARRHHQRAARAPIYYGVERPFVDTVIIPTTWFETGVGVHGEVGRGWRYRAFIASPLNAREFTAEEGLLHGKQKGSNTNIGRPATTGRLEYVGRPGLTAGASFWSGRSGFEFRPRFDVPVKLGRRRALPRDRLECAVNSRGSPSATRMRSTTRLAARWASTRTWPAPYGASMARPDIASCPAPRTATSACSRATRISTRSSMPAGHLPLRGIDRDAGVFGLTYWPDPDIALKLTIPR